MRGSGDSISREAAREAVWQILNGMGYSEKHNNKLVEEIDAVFDDIYAADVRPVVTCGKCKYGKYTGTEWFCDKHSGHADKFGEDASYHEYHSKYWFCADGEKKNYA